MRSGAPGPAGEILRAAALQSWSRDLLPEAANLFQRAETAFRGAGREAEVFATGRLRVLLHGMQEAPGFPGSISSCPHENAEGFREKEALSMADDPTSPEEIFNGGAAAKILGIQNVRLSRYIADLRLEVPREKSGLRITREQLEVLRTYHRNQADGPRFRESEQAREYSAALKELGRIFRGLKQLSKEALRHQKRLLQAEPATSAVIHLLPDPDLVLAKPLHVLIAPNGNRYRASFPEADLDAMGATRDEALLQLRQEIALAFVRHERNVPFVSRNQPERHRVLTTLISRRPAGAATGGGAA
ncbi:MAG TPA: hypothetical protein DD490_20650 [Acidobacteria bacterium]|nr:hypothetical protein [Acidobacteriota bacterium]